MNIRSLLIRDEGWRYIAYPDPLTGGEPFTIGVGHTGPEVHKGLIWTDEDVNAALDGDIAKARAGCVGHFDPWFSQLSEARQAVLMSMCFQLGMSGLLGFKNTLAAVRDEHYALAADGMRASKWFQQTPKRAGRLALQMASGAWE